VIEDIIDKFDEPPIPIVTKSPARGFYAQPPQAGPITRSQLRVHTMHMINSAVSNALMPRPVMATTNTLAIGYTIAVHQLALSKLTTNYFIGSIIDKEIGAALEYQHLVMNLAMNLVWETSFTNKIGCLL
jgi:hypothetical protein